MWSALDAFHCSLAQDDYKGRRRLASYRAALSIGAQTGTVSASSIKRDAAGRIHLCRPSIQSIAAPLRRHILPSVGSLFIDLDLRSAHVWIAARRTSDERLLHELQGGDVYATLAATYLPELSSDTARRALKLSILSLLCGGSLDTIREHMGDDRAERFFKRWWSDHPQLNSFCEEVWQKWCRAPDAPLRLATMTGRQIVIPLDPKRGWRTALWAHWASIEAEVIDAVLAHLGDMPTPIRPRLVVPMFDGLLVEVDAEAAHAAAAALQDLTASCAAAAGVSGMQARVEVRSTWGTAETMP